MQCPQCETDVLLYADISCPNCNYEIYPKILIPFFEKIKKKYFDKKLTFEVITGNISKLKKGIFKNDNEIFSFTNFIPSLLHKRVVNFGLQNADQFFWLFTNNCLNIKDLATNKTYSFPEEIHNIFNLEENISLGDTPLTSLREKYFELGNIFYAKNCFAEAVKDCSKAIEINPNYFEAYINRGAAYGMQGLFNEAIGDFSKAIEINSKSKEAYFNRGITYLKLDNIKEGAEDLKKAATLGAPNAKTILKTYFNIKVS